MCTKPRLRLFGLIWIRITDPWYIKGTHESIMDSSAASLMYHDLNDLTSLILLRSPLRNPPLIYISERSLNMISSQSQAKNYAIYIKTQSRQMFSNPCHLLISIWMFLSSMLLYNLRLQSKLV